MLYRSKERSLLLESRDEVNVEEIMVVLPSKVYYRNLILLEQFYVVEDLTFETIIHIVNTKIFADGKIKNCLRNFKIFYIISCKTGCNLRHYMTRKIFVYFKQWFLVNTQSLKHCLVVICLHFVLICYVVEKQFKQGLI